MINSNDEAIGSITECKNEVENQFNLNIKMILSYRGKEYESPFAEICLEYGIIHQTTAPYIQLLQQIKNPRHIVKPSKGFIRST